MRKIGKKEVFAYFFTVNLIKNEKIEQKLDFF